MTNPIKKPGSTKAGFNVDEERSLQDSSIILGGGTCIDFQPIMRGDRIIGWGIYLCQGNPESPSEFYIPDWNIPTFIGALQKAGEMIKGAGQTDKTC